MADYDTIEVVGYSSCGGCPGENVEAVSKAFKRSGAEVIHLTTCFLCSVPPCIYIRDLIIRIENETGLPVKVGTHPFPKSEFERHIKSEDWQEQNLLDLARPLFPKGCAV